MTKETQGIKIDDNEESEGGRVIMLSSHLF